MTQRPPSPPSFAPRRRWGIGFDLALRTVLVLAVMVMLNYLGSQYFKRFYLSSQTRVQLSSRTVSVLQALTNQLTITLYYDKQGDNSEFYSTILTLLNEYKMVNRKITVHPVDYVRDPGAGEMIKQKYNLTSAKDLVIFDLGGRVEIVDADALTQYVTKQVKAQSGEKELEFLKRPVSFSGEQTFTSRLLALENPQPLIAYYLTGDGEPALDSSDKTRGYLTFGMVLSQNYLAVRTLELSGGQQVPADCSLLIVAAPNDALSDPVIQKIDHYLSQGGRLFALLDYRSIEHPTGLEPVLRRWGINVMADYVKDPDYTLTGQDIKVQQFNLQNAIVSPLAQMSLRMILPRPVGKVDRPNAAAGGPEVQELAFSSAGSTLAGDVSAPAQSYPLMVAAEQKAVAGVANPRGSTRIVVAGDSFFLGNWYIQDVANRDFLDSSLNWLLDRADLVSSIAAQNLTEYRVVLSQKQQREIRWILLAGLPGIILAVGVMVWFARRK